MVEIRQKIQWLIQALIRDFQRGQLLQHAYSMAYITLLSLVPSLAVTFAVISLFNPLLGENSALIREGKDFIFRHLATGSGEQVVEYLENFIANVDIRTIGFTGFAGTLVVLILLLRHVEAALNRIFEVHSPRPLFTRFIYFWTLITLGTFLLALILGTFSGFDLNPNGFLDLSSNSPAGGVVYFLGVVIFFIFVYKIVPNRFVPVRYAASGALLATILLTFAIRLFRLYASSFNTYEAIYGAALSAVPVFLIWMYIVWLIVLIGGAFTWRLQQGIRRAEEVVSQTFDTGLKHQEYRLRAELPNIILKIIYDEYKKGQFTGLDLQNLAKQTCLPSEWIYQAIDSLKANNLIQKVQDTESGCLKVFPSNLPEQLAANELETRLWSNYQERVDQFLQHASKVSHIKTLETKDFASPV